MGGWVVFIIHPISRFIPEYVVRTIYEVGEYSILK